jgi:3-hydroxymyristoyl/3-hydroxydecanoyl-(acyl carrier protein) dehydratase
MKYEQEILIPADHPSLEGHFPGHPVVPGVVILDELRRALQGGREQVGISGLTQVKFNAPLFPGEPLRVEFEDRAGRVAFRAFSEDRPITQGEFVIRQD